VYNIAEHIHRGPVRLPTGILWIKCVFGVQKVDRGGVIVSSPVDFWGSCSPPS
jgi:hypothetical protein